MRIPNWPALVCGWVLATLIGHSVLAAELDDDFSAASAPIGASGDSGPFSDRGAVGGLGSPYQPIQFGAPGV
ncbi:MAG: hypothetical protein ACM3U2_14145 [Deltaproteobacteria bacterium]